METVTELETVTARTGFFLLVKVFGRAVTELEYEKMDLIPAGVGGDHLHCRAVWEKQNMDCGEQWFFGCAAG